MKKTVLVITAIWLFLGDTSSVFAFSAVNSFRNQNDVLYSDSSQCATGGSASAPTGDGGGCGSTDKEANKKQIWNFLRSKGLNEAAAAGIMGNMEQESGFMPTADNGKTMGFSDSTGKGCRGVVQWCHERNAKLDSFAKERGKSWDCLGLQLEYLWYEMTQTEQGQFNGKGEKLEIPLADALNGKDFSRKGNYNKSAPYNAGAIFHDYFERANTATGENLGRGERAEKIYKEFTGKDAEPVAASASNGGGACKSKETDTSIPAAECGALVEEVKKLRAEGKFRSVNGNANLDKDLENCTDGPIDRCPDGVSSTGKAGVSPQLLRAFVAVVKHIDSKGLGPVEFASMNEGHPCDKAMHPKGKAVDFWNCQENLNNDPKCKEIFIYITTHASELGVRQVIHSSTPAGYSCNQGAPVMCMSDHHNEVHMGL